MLAGLAIAYAAASLAVALDYDPNAPTTYAATSPGATAIDFAAGVGLILAGCLVWWDRAAGSTGPVTILLGVAWLAPDWWVGGETALAPQFAWSRRPFLMRSSCTSFWRSRVCGARARVALGWPTAALRRSVRPGSLRDPS